MELVDCNGNSRIVSTKRTNFEHTTRFRDHRISIYRAVTPLAGNKDATRGDPGILGNDPGPITLHNGRIGESPYELIAKNQVATAFHRILAETRAC
jgi:hypothetical protein